MIHKIDQRLKLSFLTDDVFVKKSIGNQNQAFPHSNTRGCRIGRNIEILSRYFLCYISIIFPMRKPLKPVLPDQTLNLVSKTQILASEAVSLQTSKTCPVYDYTSLFKFSNFQV